MGEWIIGKRVTIRVADIDGPVDRWDGMMGFPGGHPALRIGDREYFYPTIAERDQDYETVIRAIRDRETGRR